MGTRVFFLLWQKGVNQNNKTGRICTKLLQLLNLCWCTIDKLELSYTFFNVVRSLGS